MVSLSRSEARRSRITATPRVMPRVMTPAQAVASSSATSATMITVRLPPVAIDAAAVDAASLNSSDCVSTSWLRSTKVSNAGIVERWRLARAASMSPLRMSATVRATEASSALPAASDCFRRLGMSSTARRRASARDSAKASPSLLFQAASRRPSSAVGAP